MSYTSTDRGRPSKITFERLPVKNVNRSAAEERAIFDDVDFVTLHQAGSTNTTIHNVKEWWAKLEQQSRNGTIPHEWVDEYKNAYKRWSEGEEELVSGTHLKEWARISRSEAEMLNAVHVRTVEELADANEGTLDAYGMGARQLRQDARDFLASLNSNDTLKGEIQELSKTVEKQEKMINDLLDKLATEPKTTVKKTSKKKAVTAEKV